MGRKIPKDRLAVNGRSNDVHSILNAPPIDPFKTPVNCPLGRIQRGWTPMRGQPITLYEREKIEFHVRAHDSLRSIGRMLHRDHSVVSRELERNKDPDGVYRAASAHEHALKRKEEEHHRRLDENDTLRNYLIENLMEGWSPEQIAGKLKSRPGPMEQMLGGRVCHETIYQYIYEGQGRLMGLYQYLPKRHKKRQRKCARKSRGNKGILHRTGIDMRPREINEKQDVGHWESDSVIFSKQRPCLSVQRERKTQFVSIHKVWNKSAEATEWAIRETIEAQPGRSVESITFDNGTEGANHYKLRHDYGLDTYFCDPYCSWQKGGVENTNGLIRRYLPLTTNLSLISPSQIYAIQEKLNNRPRKSLGFATPNERLAELIGAG